MGDSVTRRPGTPCRITGPFWNWDRHRTAMSTAKIYKSPVPSVPIPNVSLFTYIFSLSDRHPNPLNFPIVTDATVSVGIQVHQLKRLALRFGYGLVNHPSVKARRGDTICIFSPNSLPWVVGALGGKLPLFMLASAV